MLAAVCYFCLALVAVPQSLNLMVTVTDENALPVAAAKITLTSENANSTVVIKGETDFLGRRQFEAIVPGTTPFASRKRASMLRS